ncbi:MAG: hypothetical protein Q7S55_02705 [Nanoarchaeota archaeon]|nr:hypothetical protein [Nanoarchaeota archaeon]
MLKRGQVTIFIIVGILVLAITMLSLYVASRLTTEELPSQQISTDFISSFVQSCLEKSVTDSIYKVSAAGGYYHPPQEELLGLDIQGEYFQLPYYFKDAQSELPELSVIESEIAAAAEDKLLECVAGFESFEKQGYIVTAGKPDLKVVLSRQTIATADFPITIKKGEEETTLTKFTITIPFNFVKKYDAVKEYLQTQETTAGYFLGGDLSAKAAEQNALFTFAQVNSSEIAAELRYDEPLKKEPLIYRFGLQFDWETSSEEMILTREAAVEISAFPEWQITETGIHTLQLNAEGEGLTFEIEPDSLPIDPQTGTITLDTTLFPNDEYLYYVKASDEFENQAMAPLLINVNANDGDLPIILPIERQTAKAGEEFRYTVSTLDADNVIFTSQTYLFQIDEQSGEIVFTPSNENKGLHSIRVDAKNEKGGTWQRWELEVQ